MVKSIVFLIIFSLSTTSFAFSIQNKRESYLITYEVGVVSAKRPYCTKGSTYGVLNPNRIATIDAETLNTPMGTNPCVIISGGYGRNRYIVYDVRQNSKLIVIDVNSSINQNIAVVRQEGCKVS